MGLDLIPVLSA